MLLFVLKEDGGCVYMFSYICLIFFRKDVLALVWFVGGEGNLVFGDRSRRKFFFVFFYVFGFE